MRCKSKSKILVNTLLISLILNFLGNSGLMLNFAPGIAYGDTSSQTGAYIIKEPSKYYTYFVNSSAAGYLWYWDARYPGVQACGEGGQFRVHSNYAYDLKPEEMGYSVVYWEYEDGLTYAGNNYAARSTGSGFIAQTILRNASDFSLVKFTWSDSRMNHTVYYGFWSDRPYIWVYIERTMNRDMLAQNAQTCNMLSANFKKYWWTDYAGNVMNFNYTGVPYAYTQPMFSALDQGAMNRYPFMALYNDIADVTVGFIYLDSTSNIRKDTHLWGFVNTLAYSEVQVDWGGETGGGRRYWRKDTVMGLEYLVFVKSGAPTKSGNIIDYSRELYNNMTDVVGDANPEMWSAVHQRFRDFRADDSFPVGVCGHTLSTTNALVAQPRTYYIPYMDQMPLMQGQWVDEFYYNVPLYSKWYFRYNTGSTLELDNQLVTESVNGTIVGADSLIGMIGWDKGSVTAYSHVKAFKDSDKLLFYGNVTLDSTSQCLDSSFNLYFNRVNDSVKISDTEYDIRFVDPLYGWSGLYLKVHNGTVQSFDNRIEIRLFNYTGPQTKPQGTVYSYNFTLWGHLGNETSMSEFFTIQPVTFRRLFQNHALADNAFGFESLKGYVLVNSTYASDQLTSYIMPLDSKQRTIQIFVKDNGYPDSLTVNDVPVSFSYDSATKLASFEVTSSGIKKIEVSWAAPDTQPPTYSLVGHNTTVAKSPIQFYSQWQDNKGLSGYIFSTNNTGSWVNDTWTGLGGTIAWANVTKVLNNAGDIVIGYRWYCNDTSNNWSDTELFTLTTIFGDIQPPTYSNIAINTTVASNLCKFSSYWQDNGGLSGYIFSSNNSGIWVNDTLTNFGGMSNWANVTKILSSMVGAVIGYRWYAVDSNDNWNATVIMTLTTTYSAKPQYSNINFNTTQQNQLALFSSFWMDDQSLSGYIFGNNITGNWMNDTWAPLSGLQSWANKTKTLPSSPSVRVEFQLWCNDSQGQWTTTDLYYLITTLSPPPRYDSIGYNTTVAGNVALFRSHWQDDTGLSGFIFSWNSTGNWQNETWTAFGATSGWAEVTKTLNSTIGVVIGFKWYANDTDNNWNVTTTMTLTTTSAIQPKIFGKTTVGANVITVPADSGYVIAVRFQAPENGAATLMSAYIRGKYGSGLAKGMIYSDLSGQTGNLLFESNQITLLTSWAWYNFTIDYHLQAGQYYWFAVFTSVESQFSYDIGQTTQEAIAHGWNWPIAPLAFNGVYGPSYSTRIESIFVTYTPSF